MNNYVVSYWLVLNSAKNILKLPKMSRNAEYLTLFNSIQHSKQCDHIAMQKVNMNGGEQKM